MDTSYLVKRNKHRMGAATLTEKEVKIIKRRLRTQEAMPKELAQIYCVGVETIRRIGRGESWSWVVEEEAEARIEDAMMAQPMSDRMAAAAARSKEAFLKRMQADGMAVPGASPPTHPESWEDAMVPDENSEGLDALEDAAQKYLPGNVLLKDLED